MCYIYSFSYNYRNVPRTFKFTWTRNALSKFTNNTNILNFLKRIKYLISLVLYFNCYISLLDITWWIRNLLLVWKYVTINLHPFIKICKYIILFINSNIKCTFEKLKLCHNCIFVWTDHLAWKIIYLSILMKNFVVRIWLALCKELAA